MPVFGKFDGTVLAAQGYPVAVEGQWSFDRAILLNFPSREAADAWANSPEYLKIAGHRKLGTFSNFPTLQSVPI